MSVYFLTGALGAGKTLAAVGRIRDALRAGKRVATNLDIHPEKLLPRDSRTDLVRLPDKPRLVDMASLEYGCEKPDYTGKTFGLIVLDELGTWFNSRTWNDKERLPVIDWFLHARKFRWDVIFIVQNIEAIDAQLRQALCEHLVRVRRLDRFLVPVIGRLAGLVGLQLRMPQIHVGTVFYGEKPVPVMMVERWWYRGTDLYAGYDTGQVFQSGQELVNGELLDMRASYSVLSPWHLEGRYPKPAAIPWWKGWRSRLERPLAKPARLNLVARDYFPRSAWE